MMKIGVLGCGNMASAVVKGIYRHNSNTTFLTFTPSKTRAQTLASLVEGMAIENLKELEVCDVILIGCKPYQFSSLVSLLKEVDTSKALIVSMMAAISVDIISDKLGSDKVLRLMPSLPMNEDEGISLLFSVLDSKTPAIESFTQLLKGSSKVISLSSEKQIDKLTVVTASGPAYVYYLIETFQNILMEWGFSCEMSKEVATQLFKGSSLSASLSSKDLASQLSDVTSNKGVTIEAIESFKKNNLSKQISEGVIAASDRSDEILKEYALENN